MGVIIELENRIHFTLPVLVMTSCDNVNKVFNTINTHSFSEGERLHNRTNGKHQAGDSPFKLYQFYNQSTNKPDDHG